ncbi:membrane-spanning 4-domains subfamily A member 4D-like isoform X2 [Channa argus]|uniref:membrane-spanning 4-domains subfamily A member 4D-like isoform X2 n=1 Tax=Channa argus TaxID=215402 RepID=UPI0035217A05
MADEAAVVEEGSSPAQSPLVAVSFQRNINRKQKFLEAEPKALGITQIGLNLFNILSASMLLAVDISELSHEIPIFISSLLVIIAGSVAIAAQNLQLRTNARVHLYAESAVMQALLFAISASLAAYCCKVVNCCGPDPKMPVITVQAPPVQQ